MNRSFPRSVVTGLWLAATALAWADKPPYPPTRTVDVVDDYHGVKVADPYRWLEKGDDPEVQAWTARQNALTRRYLDQFPELRKQLKQELIAIYSATTWSSPARYGRRYFYTKHEGTQNHAVLYMAEDRPDAEPQAVINPNTFSADGTVALDWSYPSPDGSLIAYGKSASGSERSTLYLRDVTSGEDAALVIPNTRACSICWDPDGNGFLYTRYPEPGSVPKGDENYYRHVYYHKFGTDWREDPKVFGEGQPKEQWHDVYPSSDYQWQFLSASLDWTKNDLYFRKAGDAKFRPVAVGLDAQTSADVYEGKLYLLTNLDAPRFRVMVAPVQQPDPSHWKELIGQQKGVIQSMTIAGGRIVLNILENAYSRLSIYDLDGKLIKHVDLPTLGSVGGVHGRPDSDELFFRFQSFAYPPVVFRYDLGTHEMQPLFKTTVQADLSQYETKQVWFHSKDGTSVPMFIIYKKGLKLDGHNPTILYGYGGFDISLTPYFVRHVLPWLKRGGVYAVANIRGGGEFGKRWHEAGRRDKKQNVFDDFIAAAEKLIADGYTRPEELGIWGGSNGGLLVGAVLTQRPDLFGAVVCQVPLLDMLRYPRFKIARLWIPEYGDPNDPEQFKWLYAYSPYHHVKDGVKYPAVLLTTAESDTRVDPMHARKMAARLQAATASDKPILLWVETKAGHGAGKPLSKRLDSLTDILVFFMWQLGVSQ